MHIFKQQFLWNILSVRQKLHLGCNDNDDDNRAGNNDDDSAYNNSNDNDDDNNDANDNNNDDDDDGVDHSFCRGAVSRNWPRTSSGKSSPLILAPEQKGEGG